MVTCVTHAIGGGLTLPPIVFSVVFSMASVLCCCCGLFVVNEPNGLCGHCAVYCAGLRLAGCLCKTVGALYE